MFKLTKYEFRKARTMFLTLLGIVAVLETIFLSGLLTENEDMLMSAGILLPFSAFAVAIFVFVRGVTTYSAELKQRSSYLIFMTPNSALKIVGSKYLYTFANGLFFVVLFGVLGVLDYGALLKHYGEYENFLAGVSFLLRTEGVYLDQIAFCGLFMLAYEFLAFLSTIAVAYFAITIGHTLFRDKKWRWLPSLVLFFVLNWGIGKVNGLFPTPVDLMTLVEGRTRGLEVETAAEAVKLSTDLFRDVVIPSLVPSAGTSLMVIFASMFGCAGLLERKVNL